MDAPLHIVTPTVESNVLSDILGHRCVLKLEVLQPSGSFKLRGIGHHCQAAVAKRGCTHLVSSSGGNAGLAVAYCGRKMRIPVTVIVPQTTSSLIQEKLKSEGAIVEVHGAAWDEAHARAMAIAKEPGHELIHPFDHPEIWEGHASMVPELVGYLQGQRPAAVITVVGGGGLLSGLMAGMESAGWKDVPVLACETAGAASFQAAMQAGSLITLPAITSIANTLGAKTVAKQALECAKRYDIHSYVMSDAQAVSACLRFADEHRILVEPACGAALAAGYQKADELIRLLPESPSDDHPIVFIVCGGSGVSLQKLQEWKDKFNL